MFSAEAEKLSLLAPVDRQMRREAHQFLGGKLRRIAAIDDCRDNVRRQRGETQDGVDVRGAETCSSNEPSDRRSARGAVDIVCAGDNPEQAGIIRVLVASILD